MTSEQQYDSQIATQVLEIVPVLRRTRTSTRLTVPKTLRVLLLIDESRTICLQMTYIVSKTSRRANLIAI